MAIIPWRPTNWFDFWSQDFPDIQARDGLDVYETDNEIVVEAAVPGIPEKDVNITYEDGILRIKANSQETDEKKSKKKTVHKQQRVVSFDYMTTLPRSVDINKISAEVTDGVVTVTAPISSKGKPKRIEVKAKKK
jgi:HSP20 family protein